MIVIRQRSSSSTDFDPLIPDRPPDHPSSFVLVIFDPFVILYLLQVDSFPGVFVEYFAEEIDESEGECDGVFYIEIEYFVIDFFFVVFGFEGRFTWVVVVVPVQS
jgi:hypothetical protein